MGGSWTMLFSYASEVVTKDTTFISKGRGEDEEIEEKIKFSHRQTHGREKGSRVHSEHQEN